MKPNESPFPPRWVGIDLEEAGLAEVRPDDGTYGLYDFDLLPPAPSELRGDWAWLLAAPEWSGGIGGDSAPDLGEAAGELRASAAAEGATLPPEFLAFLASPALHSRVRSNTDCSLDLGSALVPSPLGGGFLARFLADSQGCVFWYLYLPADGADHAVVSSPDFYGTAAESEGWGDEPPDPAQILFAAESFEAFVWRFWLENEIWFAAVDGEPMPAAGVAYREQYLARARQR